MDQRPSLLLQANREIAQVREELSQTDVRTYETQEQNAKRLEEVSRLDTEIGSLYTDLAVSEQRLAESLEQKRQAEQLRGEKQARHAATLSSLRESLREKEEALKQVVIPEVPHVEFQRDAKARLSEMRALESKESAQKSLAETARQRILKLKDEISREQQRQQELHRALRKAAEDHQSALENEKALKVAIQQKGADPSVDAGDIEKDVEKETEEVRKELASAKEKCQGLRKKLEDVARIGAEEVEKLEVNLKNARDDLDRSWSQVQDVQRIEAAMLENKVKAERQRLNMEMATSSRWQERVDELRQSLLKAKSGPSPKSLASGSPVGNLVTDEIRRIQQQAATTEQQLQARYAEAIQLKQQQLEVQAQADKEALEVKAKIQEIWQSLAVSAPAG